LLKLVESEGKYEALRENPTTTINNNIVVPPAFLEVDSYKNLLQHMPKLLHKAMTLHTSDCVSYLIKNTTCNPELPMYNSIKLTNKKDPFVQVSNGEKYIHDTKKNIITQLIENKRSILQQYYEDNCDNYGQKILRSYDVYTQRLDDEENQKNLENEIICMLLNVSEVIGSDEWSKKLLNDLKTWDRDKGGDVNEAPHPTGTT
jgi:hypothetical protein